MDFKSLKSNCVLVLAGPTAVGKTALAFELVNCLREKAYDPVLINADALAVYQDMKIGTASPDSACLEGIEHYLYNDHSPEEEYNVHQFREEVFNILKNIFQQPKKIAILVGGSHQYLSSFIENLKYCELETDLELRLRLQNAYRQDTMAFCTQVQNIDPEFARTVPFADEKRYVRAAELIALTGKGPSFHKALSKSEPSPWNIFSFYLEDERSQIYHRINQRVYTMLEEGFEQEVLHLLKQYPKLSKTAQAAIGYAEMMQYLKGEYTQQEMVEHIQIRTRHLAKRQLTWLRHKSYFKAYSLSQKEELKHDVLQFVNKILNSYE